MYYQKNEKNEPVYWFRPLKKESKGGYNGGGKGVAVNHEHIVAHSPVQRNFGDDIHPGVAELQRDHCKVGFWVLKEVAEASWLLHFYSVTEKSLLLRTRCDELEKKNRDMEREKEHLKEDVCFSP